MLNFVIILVSIGIGCIALVVFAKWLLDFQAELRYLGNEIHRTEGREKMYWIHKRRKLWLSLLPFVKY